MSSHSSDGETHERDRPAESERSELQKIADELPQPDRNELLVAHGRAPRGWMSRRRAITKHAAARAASKLPSMPSVSCACGKRPESPRFVWRASTSWAIALRW